jgi:hypothetical protein
MEGWLGSPEGKKSGYHLLAISFPRQDAYPDQGMGMFCFYCQ